MPEEHDPVNHPQHYMRGGIECIDVIEAWELPYHIGNALKYLSRFRDKGKPREDLEKCIWYIRRYLDEVLIDVEVKEKP